MQLVQFVEQIIVKYGPDFRSNKQACQELEDLGVEFSADSALYKHLVCSDPKACDESIRLRCTLPH